jgi:hypothetical protein
MMRAGWSRRAIGGLLRKVIRVAPQSMRGRKTMHRIMVGAQIIAHRGRGRRMMVIRMHSGP